MASVFTRIIQGELPATFVYRDSEAVAFMSINPIRPGHTLVVPVAEIDHWLDCPDDLRDHLFGVAQTIGRAIQRAWNPRRVGLSVVGLEVPHLHIHLLPIWSMADVDFSNAARSVDPADLESAAEKIRTELEAMGVSEVAR
ncbi:MAG: diadenosine tetraphosphate (Ap4A) hydrolase [Acidimicrobiia bacterium]|nr:MAG: diadenosine tetraphosphate (Ap4A) hydrolase [Acidimicrobiia bacterium]